MAYNRISADCHLDLIWLPPDLFVSEAPREMKDRMPYVADGPDGRRWVANNGATFGLAGGVGASGTQHVGLDPGHRLGPRWRHDTLLYTPAAMGRALARARHAGITCLPNISIDCSARSCGMVSVCVISMT